MSVEAQFDGVQLNDLHKWTMSGSSSPLQFAFPRCIGGLIKPSKAVSRKITLTSQRFPPGGPTKTAIEALQHDLNECLIEKQNGTLVVNGVSYTDVTPLGVSQNTLSLTDYMEYSLTFELSKDQSPFQPALKDGRVRDAFFIGYPDAPPQCGFPIFDNYEVGLGVEYGLFQFQRIPEEYGREKRPVGGIETIPLECWMVEQTENNFQKYMADYLLGPLGKQGTLNLHGLIFENAILTKVSSTEQVGASLKYTLEFQVTLAC